MVTSIQAMQRNKQVKTARSKPIIKGGMHLIKGFEKYHRKALQSTRGNQAESLAKSTVFQINIKEEANAGFPAEILRIPSDERLAHPKTSQGPRRIRREVNSLNLNDALQIQSMKQFDNRFSHSKLRKDMRDEAIQAFRNMPSMKSSPNAKSPISISSSNANLNDPSTRYNRTLMTKRFTNQGRYKIIEGASKLVETPRGTNVLPRLDLNMLQGKHKKKEYQSGKLQSPARNGKPEQNIFVQELVYPKNKSRKEIGGQKVDLTESEIASFEEKNQAYKTFQKSSQFRIIKKELNRAPLVANEEYEVLSDDNCIVKNSYNVVSASSSRKNSMPIKAVFKIVSARKRSKSNGEQDSSDDESRKSERKKFSSRKGSVLSIEEDRLHFYKDGRIKPQPDQIEEQFDGYKDFITLSAYYDKYYSLKRKYRGKQKSKKYLRHISLDDFLILNQIYPRVYSIKNSLKGTIIEPDVEFNPSHLSQMEIFMVKSSTYLYTHQYEKANYFIDKGLSYWQDQEFEFNFNKALLQYIQGNYSASNLIYSTLLAELESQKEVDSETLVNRCLGVITNLILSLLKENQSYSEVLGLLETASFRRIRMLTHPVNLKIQQLINYSTAQLAKQHQGYNSSGVGGLLSPQNIHMARTTNNSRHSVSQEALEYDQEDQETSSSQQVTMNSQRQSTRRGSQHSSASKGRGKKGQVSYARFKKRGGHDFPLKNIQQLESIRVKKLVERQNRAITSGLNQTEVNTNWDGLRSTSPKLKETHKVFSNNKAKFFNIDNIKDTKSPDYVMSMTDIISRLTKKEDIKKNKTLMYQLEKLDEVVHQQSSHQEGDGPLDADQNGIGKILAFPLEKTEHQKKDPLQRDKNEESQEDKLIDQCMRNLEELRLEVSMEYGGSLESVDPILIQYKMICNSIYTLLKEENLIDIIKDAMERRDDIQKYGIANVAAKKVSVAKDILMSALLKRKPGTLTLESQKDDQLVEVEILKEKVGQLKEIMIQEVNSKMKTKSMDYMEKVEREIKKMLVIARKKQKERERQVKQEFEDMQMTINPGLTDQLSDERLITTKSLISLLKRQRFQEMIADRFKVDKKKYLESLISKGEAEKAISKNRKSGSLTQEVLNKFQPVDPDQYSKMLERTDVFLKHIIDKYGAFFIAQQSYCMTEIVEHAPLHIKSFFDKTANILTTIPMKLANLANAHNDNQWSDIIKYEFIYNRDDLLHKMVSSALRQPKVIEYMGLEKHEWLVEVTQKFNMLAMLNSLIREGMQIYSDQSHQKGKHDESIEDPDKILGKPDTYQNLDPIPPFLDATSLEAIKDQFARLRYQGASFNTKVVDKLLASEIPMFKQFSMEIRESIYRKSHLKTIIVDAYEQENIIEIEKLRKDTILVVLNGTIYVQVWNEIQQKPAFEERQDQNKKKVLVEIPAESPTKLYTNKHLLGPGMAVPVQFLYWMKEKNPNLRLLIANQQPEAESILDESDTKTVDFLEIQNKDLSQLIFAPIQQSLLKKVELIQNVDLLCGDSSIGQQRLDKLSPYVMFVLSVLCKVQVFNMSELILAQGEIPKTMFVILEGQAKAVYEDQLERRGEVCPFTRRSIRTDIPKELKFGLQNFNSGGLPRPVMLKTPRESRQLSRMNSDINNMNAGDETPGIELKVEDYLNSSSNLLSHRNPETHDQGATKGSNEESKHSITYQNYVFNKKWSEHQPIERLTFKHHIEFTVLNEGQYIASRVVLDEGAIKNYIKSSKDKIRGWLQPPKYGLRQSLTSTMKAGFIKTQGERHKGSQENSDNSEQDDDDDEVQSQQLTVIDELQLQKEHEGDDILNQPLTAGNSALGIGPISQGGGISSMKVVPRANSRCSIITPTTKIYKGRMYPDDESEVQAYKAFLMRSQLSILVTSSTLKAMVIYKTDKAYFNEPVKKLLTEMIQDKNFIDIDRPMQQSKQLDFIRSTQKQWEQFKYKYEEHSLRESFHQKYEKYPG